MRRKGKQVGKLENFTAAENQDHYGVYYGPNKGKHGSRKTVFEHFSRGGYLSIGQISCWVNTKNTRLAYQILNSS